MGVFFPRRTCGRASDTPVATSRYILSASSSFPDVACFFVLATRPRFYGLEWIGGCGDRQAHRQRRLVKADASFWTGMPSIDRGPFVGSGGHYSPGPATRSPLLAMVEPLSDTLAPPWVFVRTSPMFIGVRPTPRRPFARRTRPQVPPTTVHFELGPRSLDPAAVFAARLPSLFETRRRLTTSATAYRRAGNQTNRLSFSSQGRWPRPPSFSYAPRRSSLSSGARRAALRPLLPAPVLVPPGYPGLPSRDTFRSAPPPPSCLVGA